MIDPVAAVAWEYHKGLGPVQLDRFGTLGAGTVRIGMDELFRLVDAETNIGTRGLLFWFDPMPLSAEGAPPLIRANLEDVQNGKRVRPVVIGTLTDAQLDAINEHRLAHNPSPPIVAEVVFIGSHIYNSRIIGDGYTIDDVVDQIASGMDTAAVVSKPTGMAFMDNSVLSHAEGRHRKTRLKAYPSGGDRICLIHGLQIHTFPAGDHGGSQAVAQQVDRGPRHIHQRIYTENHGNTFDGQVESRERSGQNHQ